MTDRIEIIRITDVGGRLHYLVPSAIARVSEAATSSQWHGIKASVTTFDGETIECQESAGEIVKMMQPGGEPDAREDNHVPGGIVRNFWRPVADNLSGYECPCVDNEPAMVENKGDFVWRGVTGR